MKSEWQRYLGFCFLGFFSLAAYAQGLNPNLPPEGAEISSDLRSQPDDSAALIRNIELTDSLTFVRAAPPWYEVDLVTNSGLRFHGWIKALAAAPVPSEIMPEPQARTTSAQPLDSKKFNWFWAGNIPEKGLARVAFGLHRSTYSLAGVTTGNTARETIYLNDFLGLGFLGATELSVMHTQFAERDFYAQIHASFEYGLHRLNVGVPFPVPELEGQGYEVTTNTIQAAAVAKYRAYSWKDNFGGGFIQPLLGAGFFFYEVKPDLERIETGVFAGQSVFVESTLTAMSIPIGFEVQALGSLRLGLKFTPLLLASLDEQGAQTPNLKAAFFPYIIESVLEYRLTSQWSLSGHFEWLVASGNSSGTGTRLGETYQSGRVALGYQRFLGGVGFRF